MIAGALDTAPAPAPAPPAPTNPASWLCAVSIHAWGPWQPTSRPFLLPYSLEIHPVLVWPYQARCCTRCGYGVEERT